MQYKLVCKNGQKIRKLVPAIRNLIFVQSTRAFLDTLKQEVESTTPIRYIYDKSTKRPLIVPDEQMSNFIAVAGNFDEQIVFLDNANAALSKGDRVRITAGVFAGVEGEVLRIKRDRRVVVTIDGIIAVATTYINQAFLQKI